MIYEDLHVHFLIDDDELIYFNFYSLFLFDLFFKNDFL